MPLLSVVVPAFNEADSLPPLLQQIVAQMTALAEPFEVWVVDDGSTDNTATLTRQLACSQPEIRLIRLSRNFGHQAALLAGLTNARGDAVITLDADLQHPPALIPALVQHWRRGAHIVQAVRAAPADESRLKAFASRWFYRVLSRLVPHPVTPGAADFRLLDRQAVAALLRCPERSRFTRGLVRWIGFTYVEVPYHAARRHAGRSKYSLRSTLRLASDAIFSLSPLPLRLAGLAGVTVSLAAALYLLFALWAALFTDRTVPGWTSLLATVLALGGMQLLVLWILGEYVGRIFDEVKGRPVFIVREDDQTAPPPDR